MSLDASALHTFVSRWSRRSERIADLPPEPLDHPALKDLGPRELADLPLPRPISTERDHGLPPIA